MSAFLTEQFGPLLGESVWHTLTVDATLKEVSELHVNVVNSVLLQFGQHLPREPHILEVPAYAHTTGYILSQRLKARTTLLDVSASTLELGQKMACKQNLPVDLTRMGRRCWQNSLGCLRLAACCCLRMSLVVV